MRVFVCGTRGIPDIPGGVERHCQELYPRIVARGHDIILSVRDCYVVNKNEVWEGVRLVRFFAPKKKNLEAFVHTLISVIKAFRYRPDLVHVHAIGPALFTPLFRVMGFRVVVTSQGPEYRRRKWGKLAKVVLQLGERMAAYFANEVIVVSSTIAAMMNEKYRRKTNVIPNGVEFHERSTKIDFLSKIGIAPGQYVLAVARLVPEKGLHDLIEAMQSLDGHYKVVIAGDADHETSYSRALRRIAAKNHRIVLTGYITGESLNQVYAHTRLFVLPSYYEGLSHALLEALSYNIPVLASDIRANKEVGLPEEMYFRCGDVDDLTEKIRSVLSMGFSSAERKCVWTRLKGEFSWDNIAEQTIEVYRKALDSNEKK